MSYQRVRLSQAGGTLLVAPFCYNLVNVKVYSWIAAFDLMGGGAPLWNVTEIPNPQIYAPKTVQEFQSTFVYPAAQMNFSHPPVAFNFLNQSSGETVFSITAPVIDGYSQIAAVGTHNVVIPNKMGWTRFARTGLNQDLIVQFQTLTHFNGIGSVLAEGYNGYVVTSGDGITKYVFE